MKRVPWKSVCGGAALGTAAAFSPGGVFVLLLAAAVCAALRRWAAEEDRRFLVRLFLVSFVFRVLLSLALDAGSVLAEGRPPVRLGPAEYWELGIVDHTRAYLRMGDSDYYSQRGYCMAQYVDGNREPVVLQRIQEYGWNAYVLVIGWFYSLFGFSPISVKWINCWIGSLHVLAAFFLAKSCFQRTIARWAAWLTALFPTLVLWSATNLKEPLFMLLTALAFLLLKSIQSEHPLRRRLLDGVLFLVTFYLFGRLGREEFVLSLAACWAAVFFLGVCVRRRWIAAVLLASAALAVLAPPFLEKTARKAVYRHVNYVVGTGMVYRYLPDQFYPVAAQVPMSVVVRGIPKAIGHYLLEPFPSRSGDWSAVLLTPQMILWYFLLPFALIGIGAGLRWNMWNCGFLVFVLLAWVLMGALSSANIGTIIRLRDMVTQILLLFAAVGFWVFARGREGLLKEVKTP